MKEESPVLPELECLPKESTKLMGFSPFFLAKFLERKRFLKGGLSTATQEDPKEKKPLQISRFGAPPQIMTTAEGFLYYTGVSRYNPGLYRTIKK